MSLTLLACPQDDDFLILVHHMEHELYDVHASLQTMVEELQQQEKESEERILELEEQLSKQVLDRLDQRLKSLEVRVKGNVDNALGSRLESMEETMTSRLASTLSQEAAGKYTGWRLPFVLLLIVIGSIFYLLYRQYLHLKKMHFL
jgi:cytochrome c-type biogenesis protein CcmH/NrfG